MRVLALRSRVRIFATDLNAMPLNTKYLTNGETGAHPKHCVPVMGQPPMTDLNDLKVFERVAAFGSFSDAGRALGIPKSTVSPALPVLKLNWERA